MTAPPKEKAAPLEAALIQTSDAENSLSQTHATCKKSFPAWPPEVAAPKLLRGDSKKDGKDAPPDGYQFADTREGEEKRVERVTMPPQDAEPLSREEILLKIIGHACGWANGHPAKWQAFLVVAGYDTRTTAEIAESLKISQRSFQQHVAAARAWLSELSAELRGEK